MNSMYLKEHLLKFTKLICGAENKETCFSKKVKGKYIFGYVKNGKKVKNIITKPVAIYIAIGIIKENESKTKVNVPHKRKRKVPVSNKA